MTPRTTEGVKSKRAPKVTRSYWEYSAWAALLLLVAGATAALLWFRTPAPPVEASAPEKLPPSKRAVLLLPKGPTIAVLPFENVSGEREQDYFADGMTDDLITDLSKISGLFVSSRNSVFAYKG